MKEYFRPIVSIGTIYEQQLNLSSQQKQQLFESLNQSLTDKNKFYTYKFIDRNCTNMVLDKVNATLGGNYITKTTEQGKSYREIINPYLGNHFYEALGINIIFGNKYQDILSNNMLLPLAVCFGNDKFYFFLFYHCCSV